MNKINIWRLLIGTITSIFLIIIVPFLAITVVSSEITIIFTTLYVKTSTITIVLLVFGCIYLLTNILSNCLKEKSAKLFATINALFAISLIIILSADIFLSPIDSSARLMWFFPSLSFLVLDLALEIVQISIKVNIVNQEMVSTNRVTKEEKVNMESVNMVQMQGSNVELRDSTELKNKILNMRSGLNKPYDEAIEEIEQTGSLNGIDMSNLLSKEQEEENDNELKIVPLAVHYTDEIKINDNSKDDEVNENNDQIEDNSELEDPLATASTNLLSDLSEDYESIHSSSLSRQDSRPEYKYISRRSNREDNKH